MIGKRVALAAEELSNVVTHGFGFVATIVGFPFLLLVAQRTHDTGLTIGVAIFATTLIAAYGASTIYHAMPLGPRKDFWMCVDQSSVYLLIAGTYTPFALGALRGPLGWTLLAIAWGAAIIGSVAKLRFRFDVLVLETVVYLALGWMVVFAFDPLRRHIGWAGIAWLFGGGLAYSLGTVFLVCQKRIRYGHCAWHVFVLVGSACHITAVMSYGLVVSR